MTVILIVVVFTVSAVLSVGAVALVLRLAKRKEWYDHIDARKIHSGEIPRLAGLGFGSVFIAVTAAFSLMVGPVGSLIVFWPCLLAMVLTLASGAYDDFHPMSPSYKLILQFISALCVIIPGFTFKHVHYIDAGFFARLGLLSYPVTFLWVVGLTNALNFIDGVDGLAGGLSAIIAFFLGIIFFDSIETSKSVLLCACLFGVLAGFLIFNAPIPKAKIFMGDCGSQFLGFTLALLPLVGENHGPQNIPVLYAAALFAIPIFDTTAAVWRRLRDGRKIYEPDKLHLHHKLINLGLGAKGVDAVVYSLQIVLGVLVFTAIRLEGLASLLVLGAAYVTALAFFAAIHFMNRSSVMKAHGDPAPD